MSGSPPASRGLPGGDVADLRRTVTELTFLADLARVTASELDPTELFDLIIAETCRAMEVQVCSLYVEQAGDLVLTATNGLNPDGVGVARMPIGTGITGEAARTRRAIPLRDARADRRFHWIDGVDQERFTAMCSVPVVSGEARVVGVLNVQREDAHDWTADEQATLTSIASQLAGIIERTELQRRLQEQLDSRSDLISIVSHDVRTPLAIAVTYIDALRERTEGDRAILDAALTELGHVSRMVDTVLSTLALEAGAIPLTRGEVDLSAFLDRAVRALERVAQGRRLALAVEPGPCLVDVDADRMRQVIDNLVLNAVRHSPEGGVVTVSLGREAEHAVIGVADEGPGVPPELRSHAFERFRRGERQSSGTGLGLFVVKTVVDAHGGSVSIDNAPGGGALFRVRLPLPETSRA